MESSHIQFNLRSEKVAFDTEHRKKILYNISRYDQASKDGRAFFSNLDLARSRAGFYKYKTINELEKYLIEFESRFTARGGKVYWAVDARDAIRYIQDILKKNAVRQVVKSKSMTSEEIELNTVLESQKISPVETDLGEFIVQQKGEKPYHIVTPAMHMSAQDVSDLFADRFGLSRDSTPQEITAFVRQHLREKFMVAGAGITGANFLIADTGSVAITENEGNGQLSTALPALHIVLAGIEKILPSLEQLDLFWPLLATHGTGQHLTAYNTILSGPRAEGETDGPEEMVVILLDNGRTHLLTKEKQRRALSCIRCGACLNACPVYRNIGGHTYGTTYTGPIGSVIEPHMKNMRELNHLSFASTLCGKCTEVCPVKIPIHELLLFNRKDAVEKGFVQPGWKYGMLISKQAFLNRWLLDKGKKNLKRFLIKKFLKKHWGPRRRLPEFADQSFRKQWMDNPGNVAQ